MSVKKEHRNMTMRRRRIAYGKEKEEEF